MGTGAEGAEVASVDEVDDDIGERELSGDTPPIHGNTKALELSWR